MEAKEELTILTTLLPYAQQLDQTLAARDMFSEELSSIENKQNSSEITYKTWKTRLLVIGGILLGATMFLLMTFMTSKNDFESLGITGMIGVVFPPAFLGIMILIGWRVYSGRIKEDQVRYAKEANETRESLDTLNNRLTGMIKFIEDNRLLDYIPREYFYPEAIEYFISLFRRKLVNTLPEAFRVYEDEMSKEKEQQQKMAFQADQTRQIQNSIDQLRHETLCALFLSSAVNRY